MLSRRRMLQAVVAGATATTAAGLAPASVHAAASTSRKRPLTYYNHSYAVLDRATADAVEHSDYLHTFADFQIRETTGEQGTWIGRYLLGRETYFELFGVGDLPGKDGELGAAGTGVSTERDGDLAEVIARLPGEGVPDPVEFQQTRDFGDGRPVPWFDAVFTTQQYDTFGAWAMEYRPEYFADPRSDTEPPGFPGDVGRERYLSDGYRDRLMRDVTGVHLAVTGSDLANTVPLLRAGGMRVKTRPDGAVASDGYTTVRFDAVPQDRVGLRRVRMCLNRPPGTRHRERLGTSTLLVGPGPKAVWTF
ncbi:hypothetical protein GCM10009834_07140 [Streptomonospora arabica]